MSFTPGAGTRFLLSTDSSGTISPSGPLSITGGTATTNTPVLSATQTWNNAAVTFTGWQLNVTDTASNAASLLMDLKTGGVSRLSLRKDGRLIFGTVNQSSTLIQLGQFDGYGIASDNNGAVVFMQNGLARSLVSGGFFKANNTGGIQWSSTDLGTGAPDTVFTRDAANTLAQRNGVNAQAFRLYNTYTDASNYERGFARWNANVFEVGAEGAGTGASRNVRIKSFSGVLQLDDGNSVWSITSGQMNCGTRSATGVTFIEQSSYTQMSEMTAPAAPAANSVRIYAEDNGSGKTRLMARFATGAAQQIAIEP